MLIISLPATCKKWHRFDLSVTPMANPFRAEVASTGELATKSTTPMLLLRPTTTVVKQIPDSPCNQIANCLLSDHCSHHQQHRYHRRWRYQNVVPSKRVQDKEDEFNLIVCREQFSIFQHCPIQLIFVRHTLEFEIATFCIFAMLQFSGYYHSPHNYVQLTFLKKVGYKWSAKQVWLNFGKFGPTRIAGFSNGR